MIEGAKIELFLGTVSEVLDRETYQIKVDVPGYGEKLPAVPLSRGEMDEPVVGNLVIIMSLDQVYHSVNFYTKLKENTFVGLRSNGKVIDVTPDYIVVGSDGSAKTNADATRVPAPALSYMKMDDAGNIEVMATANNKVTIKGNSDVEITGNNTIVVNGNSSITTSGTTDIKSGGACTINAPSVTVTGGSFTAKGAGRSPQVTGAFCGLPKCLLTNFPHCSETIGGN